ncbi:MAG: HIT domain-containing protein [Planctomycetes bacterium]|jgi:diadenosine tetraphosphate (Ap4A) HIT family hydrolase|nr:HIT domain-containing protein [Planctomycetota bacterium]
MQNCNFCLENNQLMGKILAKNELCYFVETLDPVLEHSGMIITYRHISSPFELNNEELIAIKELLLEVKNIFEPSNPSGYIVGWNIGEDAGQNVEHAHLHVIARFTDEPMKGKGLRWAFKQESNKRIKK